jgi:hypothetical protein
MILIVLHKKRMHQIDVYVTKLWLVLAYAKKPKQVGE